jgi:AraC family transcriptional regulator
MSNQTSTIYAGIEFIEGHLREEITVADIATAVGFSLYHFIRTFNQIVHHTPYDYLIRRRLSEAAHDLINCDRRIIDIALDYRFNNHETFSRAFKRMFSIQPNQWRERGTIPYRSLQPAVTLAYLEHIKQGDSLRPIVVERRTTSLTGLMIKGLENTLEVWESLQQVLTAVAHIEGQRGFYGVHYHQDKQIESCFYFAGIATTSSEPPPPPLVTLILPGGRYAIFTNYENPGSLSLTLDYFYHTWLLKSGYTLAHPIVVKFFGDRIPLDENAELCREISIPLVWQLNK